MKYLLLTTSLTALFILGCNKKSADTDLPAGESPTAEVSETMDKDSDGTVTPSAPQIDTAEALEEAQIWLRANSQRDGIITLPSGLQYEVNETGDPAGVSPTPGQGVVVHYEGRLIDGTVFDSSYQRGEPMEHVSDGFIKGWNEALSMMKPGDAWTLYVPPNLAYGEKGITDPATGQVIIPPNAALIFRMELVENL